MRVIKNPNPARGSDARRPRLGKLIVKDLRVLISRIRERGQNRPGVLFKIYRGPDGKKHGNVDEDRSAERALQWIERLCDWNERNKR